MVVGFVNILDQENRSAWPERMLGALSLLIAIASVGLVFAFSGSGYDLTDEGYYLASIAHYAEFPVSSTQFGFIYHPLYILAGENIATLRVFNALITVGLSFWLARDALAGIGRLHLILSLGAAATSLTVVNGWLISPSYNSLAVQAVLLAMIGLSLVLRNQQSDWPLVVMGIAGWLAFMAKPPTAAALAILTIIALKIGGKFSIRRIMIAGVVALIGLLLSALVIDGLPFVFIDRLKMAVEDGEILQGVTPITSILLFNSWPLSSWDRINLLALLAILTATMAATVSGKFRKLQSGLMIAVGVAAVAIVSILTLYQRGLPDIFGKDVFWRIAPFATALGAITGVFIADWQTLHRLFRPADWAILFCLALLPFAVALGSTINYWIIAACASICWTLAGLRFAVIAGHAVATVAITLMAQIAAAMLLLMWINHPYRQAESLIAQQKSVKINGGTLKMSVDRATYIDDLRRVAKWNGFKVGNRMLDLTGRSPGALFALGAVPVAEPWILGEYPGSDEFARRALLRTSCGIIANAWLLVEPGGPRALEPRSVGLRATDYQLVARIRAPVTDFPAGQEQLLLRPLGEENARYFACVAAR
jgi:hypothetical protein